MRTDILERKEDILAWVADKKPKAFICKQLKCKQFTLNAYLKKMGIDYAGNQGGDRRGMTYPNYKTAEEYSKCRYVKSSKLKEKLIKDGIKENKCEKCGAVTWMGVPLVLELHHKNGDHYDNDLENLEILCPNCHSIQESHLLSRDIYNQNTCESVGMVDKHV